ncbi:nucleoside hydrolase [Cobetia sp. MB87]|uniref:nucleoside hydrolase n=1 Tax=Cobetia sp. MB87 TaxID=2588451 RepID=UPI00140E18E5|nr:nucleoside hydrolase [Cobetia sp. MB87]NHH84992.1 Pyrimidine-specific ribonucleoside hydrolase RihA [Cobetia sp. MB87]
MKTPIIFDTDPGVDDAQAIAICLAHPDIEFLGMTTTFGNVTIETATSNALLLGELAGQEIPVAQGAAQPLVKDKFPAPAHIHGANGLGNMEIPEPKGKALSISAPQFIVEQVNARPGEITLVAVGPLGNLATALQLDPSIISKVKQVVVMGGSIREGGNVSPVAEANIFNDPHAAAKVLTAGWPLTMVGLDATHRCVLSPAHVERIRVAQGALGEVLSGSYQFYKAFYQEARGIDGCCPHDSCALAWLMKPELFTTERGHLNVEVEGLAEGQTLFAPEGREFLGNQWSQTPLVDVCVNAQGDKVVEWITDVLTAKAS